MTSLRPCLSGLVEFDPVDLRSVLIEVGNEMSVVASSAGVELVGALPLPTGRLSLVDVPEVPLRRSLTQFWLGKSS